MLSERLKGRELFRGIVVDEDSLREEAKDALKNTVNTLVLTMKITQDAGLMSGEEIEDLVIGYIEDYERRYYSMFDDEFTDFMSNFLGL